MYDAPQTANGDGEHPRLHPSDRPFERETADASASADGGASTSVELTDADQEHPQGEQQRAMTASRPVPSEVRTLILKGGGVKGLAFVGALLELEKAGYHFDTFVGTSAGAVTAALLGAGFSASDLETVLRAKDFGELRDAGPVQAIWNLLIRGGIHQGNALESWVTGLLRDRFPDEKTYPEIKLADLGASGKRVILFASHARLGTLTFDSGQPARRPRLGSQTPVSFAVRLSSSIPLFFVPREYDGVRVYDGGLLHNFPVEVYQKVRAEESSPGEEQDRDFLALYLGRPAGLMPTWPLLEAIRIMLNRDDTIVIKNHAERSLLLDTDPIVATDFDLSDDEKTFLLAVGRAAALRFLGDPTTERAELERDHLRKRAIWQRRRRRLLAVGRGLLGGVASALSLWAAIALVQWIFRIEPQFERASDAKHHNTYLDNERVISPLGPNAVAEIESTYLKYGSQYTDGTFPLTAVFQATLTTGEGAVKVVIGEGTTAEGLDHLVLKASSSNDETAPRTGAAIFVEQSLLQSAGGGRKWRLEDRCRFSRSTRDGAQGTEYEEATLAPGQCLPPDTPFRLLQVTAYRGIWKEAVEPWILHSHRLVDAAHGRATYVFMGDPENDIVFIGDLYSYGHAGARYYTEMRGPKDLDAEAWSRAGDHLPFLRSIVASAPFENREMHSALAQLLARLDELLAGNGRIPPREAFAFAFDRKNAHELEPQHLNIITFVERLSWPTSEAPMEDLDADLVEPVVEDNDEPAQAL